MVERRVYLPSVGFYFLLATMLTGERLWRSPAVRWARNVAMIALVLLFGLLSLERSRVYASAEALWRDVLSKYPQSLWARTEVARAEAGRGNFQGAIELLTPLLSIRTHRGYGLFELAGIYARRDTGFYDPKRAHDAYAEIMQRGPAPLRTFATYNSARLYQQEGQLAEAEELYRRTLELDPGHARARHSLSAVRRALGR